MFDRLRTRLPSREQLLSNRWLRWLAPFLGHPKLWHWSRRGVSLGVSLGVFFGLLIPVAQIPLSVISAVILRANVPVAVVSTLVSNPVTYAPIYYGAYRLGAWVTGGPSDKVVPAVVGTRDDSVEVGWRRLFSRIGLSLLVGLGIAATTAGLLSYVLISLGWYLHVRRKRRRKLQR